MHHDIGGTAGCLERWQRIGAFWVHHGELTTYEVTVHAAFQVLLIVTDHTAVAHLTACSGQCHYGTDGIASLRHCRPLEEVPYVTVVGQSVGDGFRRVDDTAATHGEHEVNTLLTAQFNTFSYQGDTWVGHYAA